MQTKAHQVAILVDQHTAFFELGCAVELFALPRSDIKNWYNTEIVSLTEQEVISTAGLCIGVNKVSSLQRFDTVVIPSWQIDKLPPLTVVEELQAFNQKGGRLLSFCSGAFLLGYCELLNDRPSCTHWRYYHEFEQRFPNSQLAQNVLYIYEDNIGCSAGSAAALDLGLAVIKKDYGHDIANLVAKRLVTSVHRQGSQQQFVEKPVVKSSSQFSHLLDWISSNLDRHFSMDDLAKRCFMSRRNFDRQFRASLGCSPKHWIDLQRIELAKHMLENTDHSMEQIAQCCGLKQAITLRNLFNKHVHVSPSQYRLQFKAIPVLRQQIAK